MTPHEASIELNLIRQTVTKYKKIEAISQIETIEALERLINIVDSALKGQINVIDEQLAEHD